MHTVGDIQLQIPNWKTMDVSSISKLMENYYKVAESMEDWLYVQKRKNEEITLADSGEVEDLLGL